MSTEAHVRQPRRMMNRQLEASLCSCGDPWPCKVATGEQRLEQLRQQVQQARDRAYESAIEHGEMSGHEVQEVRAYERVQVYDEVLGWLAPEGER